MSSKKLNYSLIGLAAILCLALIFGAHVVAGLISSKSDKLISLQLQQQSLNDQESQLEQTRQNIKQSSALADIAKTIVPQDKNQAETVREIIKIASSSDVPISQITFPKSDLTDSSQKTHSQINVSQLTQVKGLGGVYSLPITVASDPNQLVSYDEFISFLQKLENNRRTAQVTDISLVPSTKVTGQLSFTLTINEYIKP